MTRLQGNQYPTLRNSEALEANAIIEPGWSGCPVAVNRLLEKYIFTLQLP